MWHIISFKDNLQLEGGGKYFHMYIISPWYVSYPFLFNYHLERLYIQQNVNLRAQWQWRSIFPRSHVNKTKLSCITKHYAIQCEYSKTSITEHRLLIYLGWLELVFESLRNSS